MKKRIFIRVICLSFIFALALCLWSCDEDTEKGGDAATEQPQGSVVTTTDTEKETEEQTTDPPHTHSGGNATCSQKAVCDECGKEYGELYPNHPTAAVYSKNDTHHWYAVTCSHTDVKVGYATHSFTPQVTPPTCTEDGYTTYTCDCGYSYQADTVPARHTFASTYTYNTEQHWYPATCGHASEVSGLGDHSYTTVVTPPTCTEDGYTTYTCDCGYSYQADTVPARHTFASTYTYNTEQHWYPATCGHASEVSGLGDHSYTTVVTPPTCTERGYTTYSCVCGYSYQADFVPKANHSYTAAVTSPTCTEQGYTTYTCACTHSYKGDYVDPTGHNVTLWTQTGSTLTDPTTCSYTVTYGGTCGICRTEQTKTDSNEQHSFYWHVSTEASCQGDGEKVKLCASEDCCYHTTPKERTGYSDRSNHLWDDGTTVGSVTTYTCACGESKRSVEVSGNAANVSGNDLAATDEVKLSDIVIGFDDAIKQALSSNESVSIGASALVGDNKQQAMEALGLNPTQIAQIGDSAIYDFTLNNGTVSQLGGTATVRVPYTLKDGENPENILVWYVEGGTVTAIHATYENGYAVFETDHFSYYTVVKLTPAQRCAHYGHSADRRIVAPTCTKEGFTVCLRCAQIIERTAPTGHSWDEETVITPKCEEVGLKKHVCSACGESYDEVLPAIGHDWGEETVSEPTCETDGLKIHSCSNCGESYDEILPAIGHDWGEETVSEPTWETDGLKVHSCPNCGESYDEILPATGHSPASSWTTTEQTHFHSCIVCGAPTDESEHEWDYGEATEEHGVSCTVCEYVREGKVEPKCDNTLLVNTEAVSDGQTAVTVKLLQPRVAGIWLRITHGTSAVHADLAYEGAVYHDEDGRLNYILVSEDGNVTEDLTLITFTVFTTDPELAVEVVEIYAFDEEYNIIVPDYAEA